MDAPRRITGPLKTWYDLHEAIGHESAALAATASALATTPAIDPDAIGAFADRFSWFEGELRTHSEVEDGIMFPAIVAAGGAVDPGFRTEHQREQALVYDAGCAILDAKVRPDEEHVSRLAELVGQLHSGLVDHLQMEEEQVLPQVEELFTHDEQADLLRTIIGSIPPDPRLQPWVAGALTPDHREARLRNMAASLAPAVLAGVMAQIHKGVEPAVWTDIEARLPELAALVDPRH